MNKTFGFIKPAIDAHTLGISSVSELLQACGYKVVIGQGQVSEALNDYQSSIKRQVIIDWIREHQLDGFGISYRLDHDDAINMVGYLVEALKEAQLWFYQGGPVEQMYFAGLDPTCQVIKKQHEGLVTTFSGGETPKETLLKFNVPEHLIPDTILQHDRYDALLYQFGEQIINKNEYLDYPNNSSIHYSNLGSRDDHLIKRLEAYRKLNQLPLTRAHVGPYRSNIGRHEALEEFYMWIEQLAQTNYLDILSMGTSQLSQSAFGEVWGDRINGGGVPINSIDELEKVYHLSRPMLVRTYAGTKNIPALAKLYEKHLNISWHALSLWWFNELDDRGPYDLLTNLQQHVATLQYIATTNKPFEANVSHHFAFRGGDDLTYVVSTYLAAKLAKKQGIKVFVLQNMLNTPRLTSGINDIAKARALLKLVRSLEDKSFRVIYQPRAGLDYFKPDFHVAKIQLAAISALMDDVEPNQTGSPEIVHVVSYSEALELATPSIINESIQITKHSISEYRKLKQSERYLAPFEAEIHVLSDQLHSEALKLIHAIEAWITDPYSALGFYQIFAGGFLNAPYLWKHRDTFPHTVNWETRIVSGQVKVMDGDQVMSIEKRLSLIKANLLELGIINLKKL